MVHELGVGLSGHGHDVTVLTPDDALSESLQVRVEQGIRVARVKSARIKGTGRLLRAIREATLSGVLWRRARRFLLANPADLILFYSPTIFFGELVRLLKRYWGCPAYLILRDIFPQWAVDAGLLRKGLIWRYFRMKELAQYDAADLIGVQSPANLAYFASEFPTRQFPLEVLYNWAILDSKTLPPSNLRERLKLHDRVIFLYGGNIGVAQDIDNIVRLAARLACDPKAHFLLIGDGSEVPRLEAIIRKQGLTNIQILPGVCQQEYLSMLFESDVGLISLDRRLKTHNLPGKLLSYMYCSKPVLASINDGNDLHGMLTQNGAGFCLLNGDNEALCTAALRLVNEADLRKRMGLRSRELLENVFSVDVAAAQVVRHFPPRAVRSLQTAAIEATGRLVSGNNLSSK